MRFACCVGFALGLVPLSAHGQDDLEEARARFELAEQHFEEGDFALALTEFERVYEVMRAGGHPNAAYVVYNIAIANEQLGREEAALEAYERFLAESPPDAPNREDAERRMRELRERVRLAQQDDAPSAAVPASAGVSPVGIVVTAIGGAALIAGAIVGGVALAASGDAQSDCSGSVCPVSARDGIASAQTLANVADGLLFGGAAVAATGVILMLVLQEDAPAPVAAGCDFDGCRLTAGGSF